MRHTTIIDDGPRRLRVTVELESEPIETEGVPVEETILPPPPRLPADMRETVRPPLRLVTEPRRRVA